MRVIEKLFPKLTQYLVPKDPYELAKLMDMHGILSDVIPKAPRSIAEVVLSDGSTLQTASEIRPSQLALQPTVKWPYRKDNYYFFCMLDADAPSRSEPILRHYQHWLVANIHESDIQSGHVYTEYSRPLPKINTGLHRYVFLVYHQPQVLTFSFQTMSAKCLSRRGRFNLSEIVKKYSLKEPIAGNFVFSTHLEY